MRMKPMLMLLIVMLGWMSAPAVAHQQSPVDTLKIYSEIVGDYEFYFEQQYSPIKIYLKNSVLMGQERGRGPITPAAVNLDELEFKAYNGEEYFKVTFSRNTEGRIGSFVLLAGDTESYAERVLDTTRPTLFSVEQLREDFQQLRAAVEGFSKTRGIVPDVAVVSTIEDLLNRRDVQKEYVLRLIAEGK